MRPFKLCWEFWSLPCRQQRALGFLSLEMEVVLSVLQVENITLVVTWRVCYRGKVLSLAAAEHFQALGT